MAWPHWTGAFSVSWHMPCSPLQPTAAPSAPFGFTTAAYDVSNVGLAVLKTTFGTSCGQPHARFQHGLTGWHIRAFGACTWQIALQRILSSEMLWSKSIQSWIDESTKPQLQIDICCEFSDHLRLSQIQAWLWCRCQLCSPWVRCHAVAKCIVERLCRNCATFAAARCWERSGRCT